MLCFDTLLQVLILKVVRVAVLALLKPFASDGKSGLPPRPSGADTEEPSWEMPVFCQKSLDLLDYKGVDFFGSAEEFVTVSNGEG